MTLNDIATRVAKRANKSTTNSEVTTRIKEEVNYTCRTTWNHFQWTFRNREYFFTTVAPIRTGTVSVTNGSRTFTFSSSVLTASVHTGAWIRVLSETPDNWYKIRTVSSGTVALIEPEYLGDTDATADYELLKTDYLLPTELKDFSNITITGGLGQLTIRNFNSPISSPVFPLASGSAREVSLFNQEAKDTTYSDGTVTATINTRIIAGSGTLFLANVVAGDIFSDNTTNYTVQSVDSDTELTLYNHVKAALSGAAYTVTRRFGKIVRLLPSNDDTYSVVVKGLRKYSSLVNDIDFNELTEDYPDEVEEMTLRLELSSTPDNRENDILQVAGAFFQRAQATDQGLFPAHNRRPIFNFRHRIRQRR